MDQPLVRKNRNVCFGFLPGLEAHFVVVSFNLFFLLFTLIPYFIMIIILKLSLFFYYVYKASTKASKFKFFPTKIIFGVKLRDKVKKKIYLF